MNHRRRAITGSRLNIPDMPRLRAPSKRRPMARLIRTPRYGSFQDAEKLLFENLILLNKWEPGDHYEFKDTREGNDKRLFNNTRNEFVFLKFATDWEKFDAGMVAAKARIEQKEKEKQERQARWEEYCRMEAMDLEEIMQGVAMSTTHRDMFIKKHSRTELKNLCTALANAADNDLPFSTYHNKGAKPGWVYWWYDPNAGVWHSGTKESFDRISNIMFDKYLDGLVKAAQVSEDKSVRIAGFRMTSGRELVKTWYVNSVLSEDTLEDIVVTDTLVEETKSGAVKHEDDGSVWILDLNGLVQYNRAVDPDHFTIRKPYICVEPGSTYAEGDTRAGCFANKSYRGEAAIGASTELPETQRLTVTLGSDDYESIKDALLGGDQYIKE